MLINGRSMTPEILTWLEQIRERIEEIEEDVASVGFAAFLGSRPLERSAERNIPTPKEEVEALLRTHG